MSEVQLMAVELLEEMEDMTPEQIEQIRTEWFDKMEKEDRDTTFRVGKFIHILCDMAIEKTKNKAQTA